MVVRDSLKVLMAVLALVGITGMYLRQVRQTGVLGLVGYLLFGTGYVVIMCIILHRRLRPALDRRHRPLLRQRRRRRSHRPPPPPATSALLQVVVQVQGFGYLPGGLLFGIALYRARVLARWAAALLAVGGVVTVALPCMPDAFYRFLAFPNGIAMIGLGYSLWRVARADAAAGVSTRNPPLQARMTADSAGPGLPGAAEPGSAGWWVPRACCSLAAIPVLGGAGRLVEVLGGPEVLPTDARFAASPGPWSCTSWPSVGYVVLGAFQFSPRLRRRPAGLAPPGRTAPGGARPGRRLLRAVDDADLPPQGGDR